MKMTCEIIKDLIPMYTDKTASFETTMAVKEHLENCSECRAYYEGCKRIENKEKQSFYNNESTANRNCASQISNLDREFASFSGKLKKRRIRQNIIAVFVLVAMAVYVVLDIMKTQNKTKDN